MSPFCCFTNGVGVRAVKRALKWVLSKQHWLGDRAYLYLRYFLETGKRLELARPVTFCDKLNRLKLDTSPGRYAPFVDKLAVRALVAKAVGREHLVRLLGVYARPEHIAWHELPDKFAVKCSHGSHCGIAVTDKARLDIPRAVRRLDKWLHTNWYWYGREGPYRAIPPRILVEEWIGDAGAPVDYKFMCFGGEPEIVQVHKKDRRPNAHTIDFFTAYGQPIAMRKQGFENSAVPGISRKKLKDMLPIARTLARETGAEYVRVDLYHERGQVWFSELTFFDSAGFRGFCPEEANKKLGGMIRLNGVSGG